MSDGITDSYKGLETYRFDPMKAKIQGKLSQRLGAYKKEGFSEVSPVILELEALQAWAEKL